MSRRRIARVVRAMVVVMVCAAAPAARAETPLLVYDFTLGLTPHENVDAVRMLGFQGLVTRIASVDDLEVLDSYARYAASLDDFRLLPYIAFDFSKPEQADVWRDALPVLAEVGAPLWVVLRKAPSKPELRMQLQEMAVEAEAWGLACVVYPHWNTDIETAEEAAKQIDIIGHPNLRNSLHTCHEIRGGNQDDMAAVVAEHAAQSEMVAIAGAAADAYVGPPSPFVSWNEVIKPLDEGDWSLQPFLQALHESGYDGPVILQTFGITDGPLHLRRSIGAYDDYLDQLSGPGGLTR